MDYITKATMLGAAGLIASIALSIYPNALADMKAAQNVPEGLTSYEKQGWKDAEKVCGKLAGAAAVSCADDGLAYRAKNAKTLLQKDGISSEQFAGVSAGIQKWREAKAKDLPVGEIQPAPAAKPQTQKPAAKKPAQPENRQQAQNSSQAAMDEAFAKARRDFLEQTGQTGGNK